CRRAGIPADRCHDIGLAVDPAFTAPLPTLAERAELRTRLGLYPDRFVVLVCGGADGSGGIARHAAALAASGLDIELAVIWGRYLPHTAQLVDAVAELAAPASPGLARMRAAVRQAARPDATARIAELVRSMARTATEQLPLTAARA